jgi:hypothetical protein
LRHYATSCEVAGLILDVCIHEMYLFNVTLKMHLPVVGYFIPVCVTLILIEAMEHYHFSHRRGKMLAVLIRN